MNIIDLEFKGVYIKNNFINCNEGSCFLESPREGVQNSHMNARIRFSEMRIHNFC